VAQVGWLATCLEQMREKLHDCNDQDLAYSLQALARIHEAGNDNVDDFIVACLDEAARKLSAGDFTRVSLSQLLGAMHCLDITNKDIIQYTRAIAFEHKDFTTSLKHQLYVFHKWLVLRGEEGVLSEQVLQSFKKEIQAHVVSNNTTSYTESIVGEYLLQVDSGFESSCFLDETGTVVDFLQRERKVVLQFDGPNHFRRDGTHNTSTSAQTRMLRISGFTVVRLSYAIWRNVPHSEKTAYLSRLIHQAKQEFVN
jgi:hypothetical protein